MSEPTPAQWLLAAKEMRRLESKGWMLDRTAAVTCEHCHNTTLVRFPPIFKPLPRKKRRKA